MAVDLSGVLVVAVSSRALFRLEDENALFDRLGLEAFHRYQREHEDLPLDKGDAFPLVRALLQLNKTAGLPLVEVVIVSKNSPDTGMRILNSVEHYGLDISRFAFTGGKPIAGYLPAYSADLLLSKDLADVQAAIDIGCPAACIYESASDLFLTDDNEVRLAFDADAVVFSEESEYIYKTEGLEAFLKHEKDNQDSPLNEGPFAKLLAMIAAIQQRYGLEQCPIRIAIVTARNSPAEKRVIKTLRHWGVSVNEAFFLGGLSKDKVLEQFRPHIFFDDQDLHVASAAKLVPSGIVPYKSKSPLKQFLASKTNNNAAS